ncbi:MAG: hypothetical protein NTU49_00725, partial [Gammaproteobacteria bacterium]|nr:hypothetical protein [Gammaproteobacteria bacterium]
NSLFCADPINDQYAVDCQSPVMSIAWFAQMARDENLNANEINSALNKLEDFLEQKEFEKAEIAAELQLACAFRDALEEKQVELIELMTCKK